MDSRKLRRPSHNRIHRFAPIALACLALALTSGCITNTARTAIHAPLPAAAPAATPQVHADGDWSYSTPDIWPLAIGRAEFSSGYGERRGGGHVHMGLDLRAPEGTPVVAPGNGVILSAEPDNAYGLIVRMAHGDGLETWYAHLSEAYVAPGDTVNKGEVIGAVGATGRATGNHLHYEVRVNGNPIDPMNYIPKEEVLLAQKK